MKMQFYLTPSAGKRLIAKGVLERTDVRRALEGGTLVVIMGTTNAYIANELLRAAGRTDIVGFGEFHRGVSLPPGYARKPARMRGDLVISKGEPSFTDELAEVCRNLCETDVILKGANAVNLETRQAAVLVGAKETGGTLGISLGSKAKKIFPVGVEKRVGCDLSAMAAELCGPDNKGPDLRLGGEPFTELDAVKLLTGADALVFAGGGICGAEGGAYFLARGSAQELDRLMELVGEVEKEPPVFL